MNNKSAIDDIPKEMLPAVRMMLLDTINSGLLTSAAVTEVKAMISYIESKMKDNGVSLNTSVSSYDMEKAQKYMGGFSGINNNYYNNNSDDDIIGNFFAGFVGVLIVLGLIVTILKWIGSAISFLWTSGIIPMILGAIGLGAAGFGIYKLYENGFFDKVKEYFENKKNQREKKKKQQKSVSQVKSKEKTTPKVSDKKEKENELDSVDYFIKNFLASSLVITMLGTAAYHIVDKNEFNGKKISLGYYGRTYDQQYRPQYEFNPNLQVLLNSRSSKDIMYDVPEDRSWFDPNNYSLNYSKLVSIVTENIDDVNWYIATGKFRGDAHYYHINKTLYPFLDNYDTELVEMFMDYRNAIVYYAANDMRVELYHTLNAFYLDCHLMFSEEKTYQLGDPFGMYSYKFASASPLAKVVVLQICDSLLQLNYSKAPEIYCYSNKLSRGYYINFEQLKDFVDTELNHAEQQTRYRKHVKYYWNYD